ncbi:hypothetical protein SAMN02745866_00045 [Alteromonadaceae bacterium Bs31]|nr:hypothetical protein SAMN02745866_00045 [Alteromonadaceae bacterium Bs31]
MERLLRRLLEQSLRSFLERALPFWVKVGKFARFMLSRWERFTGLSRKTKKTGQQTPQNTTYIYAGFQQCEARSRKERSDCSRRPPSGRSLKSAAF